MDFLRVSITTIDNPSFTAGDSFSGVGQPSAANNSILRPPKRPVGRPKGSKKKPKTVPPRHETRSLNSTVVQIPIAGKRTTGNNDNLRQVKRSVGRPKKDSKNKPKTIQPPIDIHSPSVIEIPAGENIVQSLLQFCRRHQVSLNVLNASGHLSDIIPFHQPSLSIPGPFPILSLSGIVRPTPPPLAGAINSPESIFPFVVFLSTPGGAVCGGRIGSSATAASVVKVVATMTMAVLSNAIETL